MLALTLRVVLSTLPDNAKIEPKALEIASLIQIIEAATNDMDNQINPSCSAKQHELNPLNNLNVNTKQLPPTDDHEFLVKYTNKTLRACILLELIRFFQDEF